MDVCDRLCTALGCSSVRDVELTSYQLIGIAYEWYKGLLRSRLAGSPRTSLSSIMHLWKGLCLKVFVMPRYENLNF